MAFRCLTRNLFLLTKHANISQRLYSSIKPIKQYNSLRLTQSYSSIRCFSSVQTNDNAYRDLDTFLQKEIQLEKNAQKHPSKLPIIPEFQAETNGPNVTLTRQMGSDKIVVKFNVTNSVNANEDEHAAEPQPGAAETANDSSSLKSRPTFTVDINRGGQILSFVCSYLPQDYPDATEEYRKQGSEQSQDDQQSFLEDFQIDEFAIHDGDWNETVYSSDCSVIDGELYDKLLNLLEEHGIGEDFANRLADFSTAYEHRQYIGLLEKLQKFVKK